MPLVSGMCRMRTPIPIPMSSQRWMNKRYIAVKVDQDSRPDLSNRYEDYGWPATIVFNNDGTETHQTGSGYIPPKPMASMLQAVIDDPTPGPSGAGTSAKIEVQQCVFTFSGIAQGTGGQAQ